MGRIGSIDIHECKKLKAKAFRQATSSWLQISFNEFRGYHVNIHMPFDKADLLADAINKGEAEWADLCASEQEADEKINGSVASDNRLGAFELLGVR